MAKKYTANKLITPADIFDALKSRLYCEHCHVKFVNSKSLLQHRMFYCYKRQQLPRSSTVSSEANAAAVREELHENDESSDFQESGVEKQPQDGQLEAKVSNSDPSNVDFNANPPSAGPSNSDFIADPPDTISLNSDPPDTISLSSDSPNTIYLSSDSPNEDSNSDPDSQNSAASGSVESDRNSFLERMYRQEVLKLPLSSPTPSEPSTCAELEQKFEGIPDKEYARRLASRKRQKPRMLRYACLERSTRFYIEEYPDKQVV